MEEEPGGDEEHHRHGDLGHHERVAQPAGRRPAWPRGPERPGAKLRLEAFQAGRMPKATPVEKRQHSRECDDAAVDADAFETRQDVRHRGEQELRPPGREEDSAGSSDDGEDDALGQDLSHEARSARAQGRADRELRASRGGPREKQVREVRARDQKDQADRAREDPERAFAFADDAVEERDEVGPQVLVFVGMLGGEMLHRGVEISARGRRGDAGREAQDGAQHVRSAGLRGHRIRDLDGREDVGRNVRELELRSEDAGDRVGDASERDGRPTIERSPANWLCQKPYDRATRRSPPGTSSRRPSGRPSAARRAEGLEELPATSAASSFERLSGAGQIERHRRSASHRVERARRRAQIRKLGGREVDLQRDEAPGIGIGKWREEHALDDAEDRGVGADAEGERRDGRQREAGALRESPERVLEVLRQSPHASSY